MIESLSVEWKKFVNVYLIDRKVYRVEFSDYPVENLFESRVARRLRRDLEGYFKGKKVNFCIYEVHINVTPFVRSVFKFVRGIPYGRTLTYGEVARSLKTSPRSVGRALNLNPTPILIPCHRVVSKGGLGGFSYGSKIKFELLKLEGVRLLSSDDLAKA